MASWVLNQGSVQYFNIGATYTEEDAGRDCEADGLFRPFLCSRVHSGIADVAGFSPQWASLFRIRSGETAGLCHDTIPLWRHLLPRQTLCVPGAIPAGIVQTAPERLSVHPRNAPSAIVRCGWGRATYPPVSAPLVDSADDIGESLCVA